MQTQTALSTDATTRSAPILHIALAALFALVVFGVMPAQATTLPPIPTSEPQVGPWPTWPGVDDVFPRPSKPCAPKPIPQPREITF